MLKYHPDTRYLTDYAAASLPMSQAICVTCHLHFCDTCKSRVRELTDLGAELFVRQDPIPVQDQAFSRLQSRINALPDAKPAAPAKPVSAANAQNLPTGIVNICRGNLDNLRWRNIGRQFRFSRLALGDATRETSLLHISAGGRVPHHSHKGDEITVILKGSFSDHEDKYATGDFIVRTPGEAHCPVASQDEDCLCISTLDAPITMSNWLLRLLMPFFNRQPA